MTMRMYNFDGHLLSHDIPKRPRATLAATNSGIGDASGRQNQRRRGPGRLIVINVDSLQVWPGLV